MFKDTVRQKFFLKGVEKIHDNGRERFRKTKLEVEICNERVALRIDECKDISVYVE